MNDDAAADETTPPEEPEIEVEGELVDNEDDIDTEAEIPFHGIAIPIGKPSGDKRQLGLADGTGITWRELPLPLTETHVEHGITTNVTVGKVTEFWIDDDKMLRYKGVFRSAMDEPRVSAVIGMIVDGSVRGVSVDVDDLVYEIPVDDTIETGDVQPVDIVAEARVAGLAFVTIPAFPEAYIALGEEDCTDCEKEGEEPEELPEMEELAADATFAPGTKDGPGWITHPRDTQRLRTYWVRGKGAAKIKWGAPGDFNRCRRRLAKYIKNPQWLAGACANMHKEALGVWPGQEKGRRLALAASGALPEPAFRLVASADSFGSVPSEWFRNPALDGPTQTTITDEGRIFGHLATWGTCHIGITGVCTTPPASASGYAYFHSGSVHAAGGDAVSVGHFTMGTGHASMGASAAAATAHYDREDSAFCDVVVGEDAYGIWFAGAIRDSVSDSKLRELRATGSVSGDWRRINGSLELVGVTAVGVPGFPVPRTALAASGTEQMALVASGIVTHTAEPSEAVMVMSMVEKVAAEVESRFARKARLAALEPKLMTLRQARAQRAKERI